MRVCSFLARVNPAHPIRRPPVATRWATAPSRVRFLPTWPLPMISKSPCSAACSREVHHRTANDLQGTAQTALTGDFHDRLLDMADGDTQHPHHPLFAEVQFRHARNDHFADERQPGETQKVDVFHESRRERGAADRRQLGRGIQYVQANRAGIDGGDDRSENDIASSIMGVRHPDPGRRKIVASRRSHADARAPDR